MKHRRCANGTRWGLAVLAIVALGCGPTASSPPVPDAARTPAGRGGEIDAALVRGAEYLAGRQSPDGGWRSDVYAPFREGDALTPLALMALETLPQERALPASIDRGQTYLRSFVAEDGTVQPPQAGFAYPVYMAAGSILALGERQDHEARRARDAWVAFLLERQLTEQNGWQPTDDFYGGWGYAPDRPHKPAEGAPLNPLAEPNISATVFALEALRSAKLEAESADFKKALRFIERCQNYQTIEAGANAHASPFDDGGFFFLQSDAVRNKAGVAGRDEQGRERFASYGSATADGLRALLLCGQTADSPRVAAAAQWLVKNFSVAHQPGAFEIEAARDSVYYYYCQSLGLLIDEQRTALRSLGIDPTRWAKELADALVQRQRVDGAWINADVEVREDDPLVATSLALRGLAACRRVLAAADSASTR